MQRWPETKRLLGLLVNSSGRAHGRNARRLVHAARKQDRRLAVALLAAAVAHTPEGEEVLRGARMRMARKPSAVARELLRNFPKGGQAPPPHAQGAAVKGGAPRNGKGEANGVEKDEHDVDELDVAESKRRKLPTTQTKEVDDAQSAGTSATVEVDLAGAQAHPSPESVATTRLPCSSTPSRSLAAIPGDPVPGAHRARGRLQDLVSSLGCRPQSSSSRSSRPIADRLRRSGHARHPSDVAVAAQLRGELLGSIATLIPTPITAQPPPGAPRSGLRRPSARRSRRRSAT